MSDQQDNNELNNYLQPNDAYVSKPSDFVSNELIDRNYDLPGGKINYTHITPASRIYATIVSLSGEVGTFKDIQLAINYVSRIGGGTVFIKNGTYIVEQNISIPSGITLLGESRGEVVIDFNGTDSQIICEGELVYNDGTVNVTNNSTTVTGINTIWDSSLVGSSILLAGTYYAITQVVSGTQLVIEAPFSGDNASSVSYMIANPVSDPTIDNLTVQNSTNTNGSIYFEKCFNITINNLYLFGSNLGFGIRNTDTALINAVFTAFCDYGCSMYNTANFSIQATSTYNILVGNGFSITNCNLFTVFNWSVFGAVGNGMVLTNSYNVTITDFAVVSCTGYGIEMISSYDTQITMGNFANNTTDGIKLVGFNKRNILNTLLFRSNGGYGINIDTITNIDNLISSNIFNSNTSGAVNDGGTTTKIRSNIGQADN